MSESLKNKTVKGVFWSSIERFSVQGVQFIIQIIIARILLPSDYGLIGMLTIFLAVSQSLIDSGFSNALIRKQNCSDTDYSTVFYFNIIVGILLYGVLYILAPFIASFYRTSELINITRVVAITLFINSLTVVQRAKLTRNVDFKTQTKASLTAAIVSGIIAIIMAYSHYGVWALVIQSVLNGLITMILLWILSKWIPRNVFSRQSFKEMFSFGSKLLVSGLIDTLYRNLFTLIIGKQFNKADLGYYTRADQFAQLPSSNLTGIFGRVTYPILSTLQNDDKRLEEVYRKYLRLSAFGIFPLMTGLAALASPLIILLLTEKWAGVVILLQIICFSYMWYPIHAINLNLLQVKGRSDLFLRLEIMKKGIGIAMLFITVPIGINAMCIGSIATSIIALIINTHYTGKLINVDFLKQMKDLFPILLYALSMYLVISFSIKWIESDVIKLIVGFSIGVFYYFLIAYFTNSPELKAFYSLIYEYNNKLNNK
ncbi:MAG: lipopolysaccharide biosynthesis protein [Bacteroidaceae bacterium]|nr:lipopolysaccharide biosynthesis protein [Bacteroidaceae bacterium]